MLRQRQFDCEHGGHYEDPITNKSREFDIRAAKTIGAHRIRMAIECKNIRENFPILVSCVPRHEDEAYHQIALVSEPKRDSSSFAIYNIHASRASTLSIRGEHTLYPAGHPVGKSTVQVGRSPDGSIIANDSELYEKWGQCLSSLHELVQQMYWDGDKDDPEDSYTSGVLPIVVVPKGRLWITKYDGDGARVSEPAQADRCSCFVDKDYKMGTDPASTRLWISHLEIMTFNGLCSFLDEFLMTDEGMEKVFSRKGIMDALNTKVGH